MRLKMKNEALEPTKYFFVQQKIALKKFVTPSSNAKDFKVRSI